MNLHDIYAAEGFDGLKKLAALTNSDPQYLRQCATGWKGKRPSPELTARLIVADSRLTWQRMYSAQIDAAREAIAA